MNPTIVVIPAYNAAKTLPLLLERLRSVVPREEILVVNDGSDDATGETAESAGVQVLHLGRNGGKGAALRSAFEFLLKNRSFDSVVTMDADLQHDPADLPAFLKERRAGLANVILGVRRRWGSSMPLERRFSNAITSWMVTSRVGCRIRDSQCGYRLIGKEVLEVLRLESEGFEAETEMLIKSALLGFRIASVDIQTVYNDASSHMTYWETTKKFVQTVMKEY